MNLQDVIGYGLAAIIFILFGYLAWASRQEKNKIEETKKKTSK